MQIYASSPIKLWVLLLFTCLISYRAMATSNIEAKWETADATVRQIFDIRGAVFAFYDGNRAWPVSIETLIDPNNLYYGGRLDTPYNTRVNGAISTDGQFYVFSLDVGRAEIAEYIARKLNGTSAASNVTLQVGVPASYSLYKGALSRQAVVGHPELNEMTTALSLGGFDINAVNTLNTSVINAGAANLTTVNVNNIARLAGGLETTHISAQTIAAQSISTTGAITSSGKVDAKAGIKATVVEAQALNISNATVLNGATAVKGALNVEGMASFVNNVTFTEDVIFTKPVQSDAINAKTANINSLNVIGDQWVGGTVTAGNKISAPVIEATHANISNRLTATNATFNGSQTVNGLQTINGSQMINHHSTVIGNQTVGALVVNGAALLGKTTIHNGLTVNAGIISNDTASFMQGVNFVDANSSITKGNRDALRLTTKSAWLDIGHFDSGWLNIDTNQQGIKMSKPLQTPNLSVLGAGDKEVIIRSVSGGQAIVTFSNDSAVADAQLVLTDNDTLALQNAQFNANAGLVVNGQAAVFNSGATFNTDVTFIKSVSANGFVENGQALSDKYLYINDKAVDAHLIDGIDSHQLARTDINNIFDGENNFNNSVVYKGIELDERFYNTGEAVSNATALNGVDSVFFARRDQDNIFTGIGTFTQPLNIKTASGNVTIGSNNPNYTHFNSSNPKYYFNKPIEAESSFKIYNSGTQITATDIFEAGKRLSDKYLGINATAANAALFNGVMSSSYARTDVPETFVSNVRVNGDLITNGVKNTAGNWLLYSSATQTQLMVNGTTRLYVNDAGSFSSSHHFVQGNLTAVGAADFKGPTTIKGSLFAQAATFDQDVKINGSLNVQGVGDVKSKFNSVENRLYALENKPILTAEDLRMDYVLEHGISSADTITKYASCQSGYRLISCAGGALTPGNGSWEDNEGSLIEPLPATNQCRLFGEGGSGNNPVTWRLTAICMKGGV